MNKILLSISLIFGMYGSSYGMLQDRREVMRDNISKKHWGPVVDELMSAQSHELGSYIKILLACKVDLNQPSEQNKYYLLQGFLWRLMQADVSSIKKHNLRTALKELIKRDKLNPGVMRGDDINLVFWLDGTNVSRPYSTPLRSICQEVFNEKIPAPWHLTTFFHGEKESFYGDIPHRKLIWRPWCLLVDYRVWAAVGTAFIASCLYKVYAS